MRYSSEIQNVSVAYMTVAWLNIFCVLTSISPLPTSSLVFFLVSPFPTVLGVKHQVIYFPQ